MAGLDPAALEGQKVYRPGMYKNCKAIGWYVEDYKRAQVSINLTNYKVTPLHVVFDDARKLAAERGLVVTGSEIVGVVPFQALLETGRHYLKLQGKRAGTPLMDVLRAAVMRARAFPTWRRSTSRRRCWGCRRRRPRR